MASIKKLRGPIAPGDRKRSPFDRSRINNHIANSSKEINCLNKPLILESFRSLGASFTVMAITDRTALDWPRVPALLAIEPNSKRA